MKNIGRFMTFMNPLGLYNGGMGNDYHCLNELYVSKQ